MQPFIENCSARDIKEGLHFEPGPNCMLISITDPAGWRPDAKCRFTERHDFEFLDAEDTDFDIPDEAKISREQADEIASLLERALENKMNVIVHCVAGICRSGAIVEIGVMMGFRDPGKYRQPNLRVKTKLMQSLGWTYE